MSRLPLSLRPWEESLAGLDAALAVALGPLLHRVDELVGRLDASSRSTGEPDGYDGTSTRGAPDTLLGEEWLLAQEVPLEFLRRAAEGELRFLRPARRSERTSGRVVLVVDSGPEQLGGGRLVQLASLVVLDRRARADGGRVTVVDAQTGARLDGPLESLLPRWLRLRSARPADPEVVTATVADHDRADRVWIAGGPALAAGLRPYRRLITSEVTQWTATGAAAISVQVGSARALLDLPAPRLGIAALRGERLMAARAPRVAGTPIGRGAAFTSAARSVLWRGSEPHELHRMSITPGSAPRPKRLLAPGVVLAAATLGRRTVCVVTDGASVWVHTVGKALARTAEIRVLAADVELDADGVATAAAAAVAPVHLVGGDLLVSLPTGWWRLSAHGTARREAIVAAAPGHALDSPLLSHQSGSRAWVGRWVERTSDQPLLLGPAGWWAVGHGDGAWDIGRTGSASQRFAVRPDEVVLALTAVGPAPALVTRSRAGEGRLLRLVQADTSSTLTRWANGTSYSVHPTLPWIARVDDEDLRIGDLGTGEVLARVRWDR